MSERLQRRLAAILSADVVGYSRLMGADEAGTLATMRRHRNELWDPTVERFNGRVVGTAGDSILVEFASAVAAAETAIALQLGMRQRNLDVPEDQRMLLRVGLNIGEVILADDDIYGDGVNVAARLQELAEPGGIAVSRQLFDQIEGKLDAQFSDDGFHEVKNIARPVAVYRWRPDETAGGGSVPAPPALPDKPAIAVLPFDNMSDDSDQEYFADGLTEDIITELSRFQRLMVIARNTVFAYKGKKIEVPQVARELGVHFILEGSVRRAGNRVRITAQLIDGPSGGHVWAERYDGKLEDVFDLQEDVTRQVVATVAPKIDAAEMDRVISGARRYDEAHDLAWRAYAKFRLGSDAADLSIMNESKTLARRALALNDRCSVAYRTLCWTYAMHHLYSWGDDPLGDAARALEVAEAAMLAMPQTDTAFFCLGLARSRLGQFEQAVRDLQRAHELNPNDSFALQILAWCEASLGETGAARRYAMESLRLSPKDYYVGITYLSLAMVAFVERDHADFVDWARKAIQAHPVAPIRRAMMIAYAAEAGDQELLTFHLDALNAFSPDFVASLFRGENRVFAKPEHMDLLLNGLRKAGLPR